MRRLYWRDVGLAMGAFLAITYTLCVASTSYSGSAWLRLLPGFTWISWSSYLLGLLETFLYGIYFGLVFVPLYNLFKGADST